MLKNIVYIAVFIAVLAVTFFVGRCTAGTSGEDSHGIEESLSASLKEIRKLRTALLESEQERIRLTDIESKFQQANIELARIQRELEENQSTGIGITSELRKSEHRTIRKVEELEKILFNK